jgi:hypothetical protein
MVILMQRTSSRLSWVAALGLISSAFALFCVGATASADDSSDSKEPLLSQVVGTDEGTPTPDTVSPFVDDLDALITKQALAGLGYVRITDTPEDRHVDVWWKGDVPEPIRTLVREWPFKVNFYEATHTLREVKAVEEQLRTVVQDFPFQVKG